jgi:hypothetical protein
MGQKTHPIGLRIGIHRKWNFTWYTIDKLYKNFFFQQNQIETFFKTIFHFYTYTKISRIKKILLVDLKFFRYGIEELAIFVFFYKFRKRLQTKNKIILDNKNSSGWKLNILNKKKYLSKRK